MRFIPDPEYFNQTGYYVSGPYSINNIARDAWELRVNGVLIDTFGSFKSARTTAQKHYDDGLSK